MFLPLTDTADSLFLSLLCSKPPVKFLSSVLGKSNLQFSGVNIKLTISTSSLTLINVETQQVGYIKISVLFSMLLYSPPFVASEGKAERFEEKAAPFSLLVHAW